MLSYYIYTLEIVISHVQVKYLVLSPVFQTVMEAMYLPDTYNLDQELLKKLLLAQVPSVTLQTGITPVLEDYEGRLYFLIKCVSC